MLTPKPRGALSEALFETLRVRPDDFTPVLGIREENDEDAAIAVWALYELHYRGFDDVEDDLEWHPVLIDLRGRLERDLERRLRGRYVEHVPEGAFADDFFSYVADHDGPSLASYVLRSADEEQVLDLLRVRSIYHLKEADPSAWLVPRLGVETKAALVELLYDEYGVGDPNKLHSHLWARGMEACGLRPEYGAYVDEVPFEILEQNNAMSLFGLHRRLRGAALGHLAAFEATSSLPSRKLAQGLARLGFAPEMVAYYAEHVEADAVHEQQAVRTICGTLVEQEPSLTSDVYFGAFTCADLEYRFASHQLAQWGVSDGSTS